MSKMEMGDFDNMLLGLPTVEAAGHTAEFKPLKIEDSMLRILENDEKDYNVMKFEKKCPIWSEKRNSFVLNFGKRIKKASVKNTQLLRISHSGFQTEDQVYFQVSKNY